MTFWATTLFDFTRLFLAIVDWNGRVHGHIADGSVSHAVTVGGPDFNRLQVGQDAHHFFASHDRSGIKSTPAGLSQRDRVSLLDDTTRVQKSGTFINGIKPYIPQFGQVGFDWG